MQQSPARRRHAARHHVDTVHTVSAGVVGVGLVALGVAGALLSMMIGATSGVVIAGVFTNAVLSSLSVVTGSVLLAAAVRGARSASTALVVTGPLFLASGLVNAVLIGTPLDMIGFQASDVVFSWVMGGLLVVLGSYGRFTGSLPDDSPYAHPHARPVAAPLDLADHSLDARALAQAERDVAAGIASPDQVARVAAAGRHRTHLERLAAFSADPGEALPSLDASTPAR